ncbi:uncharacterized protein BX663DRAFT_521094 [Cokeromyces recurvatus]|uniref:uncharacterized protein n=1 Tax=Cokeromyces recurvatus TaxID=90255 RepID=UPI00221EE16B|nr:uncharacterized protein BX663DRAFT_521094 [Cokeromyces recurvatus]KAI7899495.1 hypothetical protein BX663DRAFT_521094 [Cokeromyces recurvatus]
MTLVENKVLSSAKFIAEHSKNVSIPKENLEKAAKTILDNIKKKHYSTKTWNEHPLHPKIANRNTVDWIFLVDLLNFSFWSDLDVSDKKTPHPDRYAIYYGGKKYTGYWSLCAAINRALDNQIPITNPAFYGNEATDRELADIFNSDTKEEAPMLNERIRVMREAGKVLCEKFDGSFVNCIIQANHSASKLLDIIVDNFSSFNDVHDFHGKKVYILKRAQILIADLWACFDGQSYGQFDDIDSITMFADYRVPQALYQLGLLSYSPALIDKLHNREYFPSGSEDEVEIRGNSIWAVELVRERINQIEPTLHINAILIDFYIWDMAKEIQDQMTVPTHCTRSCFY